MCVRAACSCLHEVLISRAGVFVGIGLGRGQRLHTWAFCYLRTPLQSEISFLADTLWSLPENHKMFDGSSPACIIFGFLVDFPCARFENTSSATRVS